MPVGQARKWSRPSSHLPKFLARFFRGQGCFCLRSIWKSKEVKMKSKATKNKDIEKGGEWKARTPQPMALQGWEG
jgi:hypothetical protein